MILLDTHVAVWLTTDTKLGKRSVSIVETAQAENNLAVSAISFWEIAMLVGKRSSGFARYGESFLNAE